MKKILVFLLVIMISFFAVSCGEETDNVLSNEGFSYHVITVDKQKAVADNQMTALKKSDSRVSSFGIEEGVKYIYGLEVKLTNGQPFAIGISINSTAYNLPIDYALSGSVLSTNVSYDSAKGQYTPKQSGTFDVIYVQYAKSFAVGLVLKSASEDPNPGTDPGTDPGTNPVAKAKTVTFYFHRYDGNYSNYYVWFWSEHRDGKDFGAKPIKAMTESNGYKYGASIKLNADEINDKLGVIFVKVSGSSFDWNNAVDQTDDLYFYLKDNEVSLDSADTLNVYYAQGDTDVVQKGADAVNAKKEKFLFLTFTDSKTISYTGTNVPKNVVVYKNGEVVESSATTTKSGKITLKQAADYSADYTVGAKISSDTVVGQSVSLDGVYSSDLFNDLYYYDGDLGALYSKTSTTFKLWAPISKSITLNLYRYGHSVKYQTSDHPGVDTPYETHELVKGEKGVWQLTLEGDYDSVYYTYTVVNGSGSNEVVDPYAFSTGLNGERGMVVNFELDNEKVNPSNWATTLRASATPNNVDKILYETHLRDITAHSTWGGPSEYAGKFMGLATRGTTYTDGGVTVSTGLDHIIELGVTHVHLLPVMDSEYVNESRLNDPEYIALREDGIYNWGYMTKYFFNLDGSYSTNPYDGNVRVYEFKKMVQTLHENGLNVVMDVVFNHSSTAGNTNFQKILPRYYHRTSNGYFTNGSGCGNELASERKMVRKLIVDSCTYFAEEYKVDGFRFDLMALEDTTTMNAVYNSVAKVDPNTIIYGEPWTGNGSEGGYSTASGGSGTYTPANKGNMKLMPHVAAFSDVTREGIRGTNDPFAGWIANKLDGGKYDGVVFGVMGGAGYCNSANAGYQFDNPGQIVNYASCHDNHALYDQVKITTTWSIANENDKIMSAVSQSIDIVLTSQGVPFIEGGSEIGRTKRVKKASGSGYETSHNSYNLGDMFNAIDWSKKITNLAYFNNVKDVIKIRKEHPAFRQTTYAGIQNVMKYTITSSAGCYFNNGTVIAYRLQLSSDSWKDIYVIHGNSASGGTSFSSLPSGNWKVMASNNPSHQVNMTFTSSTKLGANETVIIVNG